MIRVSDVASVDMRGQFIEGGQQIEYNNTEVTRDRDEPRTGVPASGRDSCIVMCQALLIFYMKSRLKCVSKEDPEEGSFSTPQSNIWHLRTYRLLPF